ncbi:hypothetical protein [Erythrobacter oryzae]|uniref:hypothetical protein n=1 Tax=Erythrobacter oryzae TaxID=3019556 RepID=UPI002555A955|nr:hypothetical protein [Erythrobacter sp. COR-2]
MTGRTGRTLGTAAFAAALAGLVGAAAAQVSEPVKHFERFTQHDMKMCFIAQYLMVDATSGEAKDRYLATWVAFAGGGQSESDELVKDRGALLQAALSPAQMAVLADACRPALLEAGGPARFTLPFPELIGESALASFRRSRNGGPTAEERAAEARAAAARLDAECRAIVDKGVAEATREFRQAQGEIKVWIRAGSFGSPPGQYDIQNGCVAIDNAGGQLNTKQCPAEYAQALMNFRAGYYIDFNGSGGFSCK